MKQSRSYYAIRSCVRFVFWTGLATLVLMVGIALMPDRPDCDVLLHEDGTWSEDGWSVISSGTTWCDLNPDGRVVGQPYLHWDRTWHIPS